MNGACSCYNPSKKIVHNSIRLKMISWQNEGVVEFFFQITLSSIYGELLLSNLKDY
jgi:hypothetical protein